MGFSLLIASALSFATGYGDWEPKSKGYAAYITPDENSYIEQVMPQHQICSDDPCRDRTALAIFDVINFRRALHRKFGAELVFDALRAPCESLKSDVVAQRSCFDQKRSLSYEAGMDAAGFRRAGLTAQGYSLLRNGLSMKDVEHVLGESGEQMSYSGYGGHSAAIYKWSRGTRIITVSFTDDVLSGKSQFGLYR